jgi:hypothetical protein
MSGGWKPPCNRQEYAGVDKIVVIKDHNPASLFNGVPKGQRWAIPLTLPTQRFGSS